MGSCPLWGSQAPAPPPHPTEWLWGSGEGFGSGSAAPGMWVCLRRPRVLWKGKTGARTPLPGFHRACCGAAPRASLPARTLCRRAPAAAVPLAWQQRGLSHGAGTGSGTPNLPCPVHAAGGRAASGTRPTTLPRAGHRPPHPQKPQAGTGGVAPLSPLCSQPPAKQGVPHSCHHLLSPTTGSNIPQTWGRTDSRSGGWPRPPPHSPPATSVLLPKSCAVCVSPQCWMRMGWRCRAEGAAAPQDALGGLMPVAQPAPAAAWLPGVPPLVHAESSPPTHSPPPHLVQSPTVFWLFFYLLGLKSCLAIILINAYSFAAGWRPPRTARAVPPPRAVGR